MFALLCNHCEGPAFLLTECPIPGDFLMSSKVRGLDGSPIPAGSVVLCQLCGRRPNMLSTLVVPYSALRAAAIAGRRAHEPCEAPFI